MNRPNCPAFGIYVGMIISLTLWICLWAFIIIVT